jgi:hypothetical protein
MGDSEKERLTCKFPEVKVSTSYRQGCRCDDCRREIKYIWKANAKKGIDRIIRYRKQRREEQHKYAKMYKARLKYETLLAYGGIRCACCGETNIHFLSLDHVHNDGFKDRPVINGRRKQLMGYNVLRKQNFPNKDRFQVLCMNCNVGKRLNGGICPHKNKI